MLFGFVLVLIGTNLLEIFGILDALSSYIGPANVFMGWLKDISETIPDSVWIAVSIVYANKYLKNYIEGRKQ